MEEKKFKISKWIFLSLAILMNAFLIYESCLEGESSSMHSGWLSDLVIKTVNNTQTKEAKNIPLESIKIVNKSKDAITSDNVILGTTSTYQVEFYPKDATNKNVKFVSNNPSINPVQSNNIIRVEGLELANNISLTAISLENESITSSISLNVIDRPVPSAFSLQVESNTEYLLTNGNSVPIDVVVDGYNSQATARLFTNPDLINYTSSNPSVATIENGFIISHSVGETFISAPNSSNSLIINVVENPDAITNEITNDEWCITGSDIAHTHDYDYIDNQSYDFYTQLSIDWKSNHLTDKSVSYKSSNETIARVDNKGRVYGHKKSGEVTITAISNADPSKYKTFAMRVEDVLPTDMSVNFRAKNSIGQGESLSFETIFEPINTTNKNIEVISSDTSILEAYSSGWNANIRGKEIGNSKITITSKANPELKVEQEFTVTPPKVIEGEDENKVATFIRKSAGHFSLFGVSGILVTITLYMFLHDRLKKWVIYALSICFGIIVSTISEIIQIFVPGRAGAILDVVIDMSGYILFSLVMIGIYYLVLLIIKKRKEKQNSNRL